MSPQYEKFKKILIEMFQMDQADLDFGIYRIMNQKKDEIEKFLDKDLLPQVEKEFDSIKDVSVEEKKEELVKLEQTLKDAGVDIETNEKVLNLRAEVSSAFDKEALTNEVFSTLATFFKRYYDGGDFMSLRRYKKDTYAIPYEGEEVKLHWANSDQYYIKSSEYLKDYTFKLQDGKKVHFKLVDASEEKGNVKEAKGKERRFFLNEEEPYKIENDELYIQFIYEIEKETQANLNKDTIATISKAMAELDGFIQLFAGAPTEKNKKRTVLEKHLNDYTAKFNFDFFIHKDLGGFLKRELDFFLKNEVIYIDDLDDQDINKLKLAVTKTKVIKHIAFKIIQMLAQLEDFQKKLWLKKKFVVDCGYCMTLDKVPEELYSEIIKNEAQIEEWKKLYAIEDIEKSLDNPGYSEPLTEEFLKANQYLMMDTKFFEVDFQRKIMRCLEGGIDNLCDGIIINTDNLQGNFVLSNKYTKQVDCIYIDPPYNAKSSEIVYKNSYKHSSWLSLMSDRINSTKDLLKNDFVYVVAIDEVENYRLGNMLIDSFPNCDESCISVVHNPTGQQGNNFSYTHEFAHFVYPSGKSCIGLEDRSNPRREAKPDVRPLRNVSSGKDHLRSSAKNCFYPIYIKDNSIVGFGDVCPDEFHPEGINVQRPDGVVEVYPIDPKGIESKWVFARDTVESIISELEAKYDSKKKEWDVIRTKSKFRYKSLWSDKCYSANSWGSVILNNIDISKTFTYPKSLYTVLDCIDAGLNNLNSGLVLDYFAGSGTTAHAVINLNREDNGNRKYILIEQGQYFDTVLKPRIQKVVYSEDWKTGKPVSRNGSSHMFKYMKLESYEDALDNLVLKKTEAQQSLLDADQTLREGYNLGYWLDIETKGSDSLLNLDKFEDPFNYTMKIRQDNELKETKVDLIETFNYLIGLYVDQIEVIKDFHIITGKLRTGEKTLVIWRNTKEKSNEDLNNFFLKQQYNTLDMEFDLIYVNGDNNLENLKVEEDKWKVRMIDEEFKRLMFDVEDV